MPISLLAAGRGYTDEQTRELVYAYEAVLASLNLTDRTDPLCEHVAKTGLDCAVDGFERASLYDAAMSKLTDKT